MSGSTTIATHGNIMETESDKTSEINTNKNKVMQKLTRFLFQLSKDSNAIPVFCWNLRFWREAWNKFSFIFKFMEAIWNRNSLGFSLNDSKEIIQ